MTRLRQKELRRRRQKRNRVGKLKKKLDQAKNKSERDLITQQIIKRDPSFKFEEEE